MDPHTLEVESLKARLRLAEGQRDVLYEPLRAMEARLTATARAFYVNGKASALKDALNGWKDDAEKAREALSLVAPWCGKGGAS